MPALLAHATYLAERLATAELTTSLDEEIHVENAHLGMEDRETIAGLRARLREAERDATASADVVGQLVEGTHHWSTLAADLTAQLARARADHAATVAAHEGREAELRAALLGAHRNCGCEDGIWHRYDDDGCPIKVRCLQCAPILAALASPDRGAGDVLAAANEWLRVHADAEVSYQEVKAADRALAEVVRTWRARRSGREGG